MVLSQKYSNSFHYSKGKPHSGDIMFEENAAQTETPEEKRRRLQRERTRKHRAKNKPPEEITSFEQIAESWTRNEAALLKADPTLHSNLLALHNAIAGWEAEAEEIEKGVKAGLQAETRTAETADSTEIFPMPDLSFRDLKSVALKQGTANYRQIEAAAINGRQGDDVEQHYVRYGFRLRIQSDTLQNARENLVLYALRTHDSNLDAALVAEAIADVLDNRSKFSPNHDELDKLIRQYQEARIVPLQNL
jgi:hypothetical protein